MFDGIRHVGRVRRLAITVDDDAVSGGGSEPQPRVHGDRVARELAEILLVAHASAHARNQ